MEIADIVTKLEELEKNIDERLANPDLTERDRRLYLTLKDRTLRSQAIVAKSSKIDQLMNRVSELENAMRGK